MPFSASGLRRKGMAASKKRRVAEKEHVINNSSSESSDDEGMDEDLPDSEIQVDFEARTPDDSDFHGIKRLLQQLFLKSHVNTGELADLVIKQDFMGSVLKQSVPEEEDDSDEDETFGVFSVIDMMQKKDLESIKQVRTYILDHGKEFASAETYEKLQFILDDSEKHVGLLISERFINIPPQISVPLYEGLSEEMKKAKKDKKLSDIAYYVLISKCYEDKEDKEIVFANAEEILFNDDAIVKFDFCVSDEHDSLLSGRWGEKELEWRPKRSVMIFPADRWNTLVEKLKTEIVV